MTLRQNWVKMIAFRNARLSPGSLFILWLTLGLITYIYALLLLLSPRILLTACYFT